MEFNNKHEVIEFIKNNDSSVNILLPKAIKNDILKEINFIHKCNFVTTKVAKYKVDDFLLPIIYNEVKNLELSREIFSTLPYFIEIDSDHPNFQLIKKLFLKGIDENLISVNPNNLNTIEIEIKDNIKEIEINKFDDELFEVYNLAHSISEYLDKGNSIEDIEVCVDTKLIPKVEFVFDLFDLPLKKEFSVVITNYDYVLEFINTFDVDILNKVDGEVRKDIINLITKYSLEDKKFIRELLLSHKHKITLNDSGIKLKSLDEINPFKKVFIVGLTDLQFLPTYPESGFVIDFIKSNFNMDTSVVRGNKAKKQLINILRTTKNPYLSFCFIKKGEEYSYLSILEEFEVVEKTVNIFDYTLRFSQKFDKYLLKVYLEDLEKYKMQNPYLQVLKLNLETPSKYDNSFLSNSKYSNSVNLNLSATSIEDFHKCQYNFYLSKILNLKSFSPSISATTGNYIHKCLEDYFGEGEIDQSSNREMFISDLSSISSTVKSEFYLNKIDLFLNDLIKYLDEQNENMEFEISGVEESFFDDNAISINDKVSLTGKIDVVMKHNDYFTVIDYKTGNANLNFSNTKYGLDLQNLIYFKLLESKFDNVKFGGTYRQKVKPKIMTSEKDFYDLYKLSGYTKNDVGVLRAMNPDNLKGIKFKKDGNLTAAALSKTIDDEEYEVLSEHVDLAIAQIIDSLSNGEFKINPKVGIESCKYCNYSSICYKKVTNYEVLK